MPQLLLVPLLPLLGGVVAWFGGWYVIPERSSAVFPERWWAHVAALLGLGGLVVGVMLLGISPELWPVGIPVTAAALLVGHYPLRRAGYGETWGLLRYGVTMARRATAFFGFWMLVAITPQLIVAARAQRWLAASLLAALMLAALRYRREILLYLVEARPFDDVPEVFRQVLAGTDMAVPVRVYRAGVPGSVWATSFSLPGAGGHVVVFGDSLVQQLDPDALTAILAHEVARLERATRHLAVVEASRKVLAIASVAAGLGLLQLPPERAWLGAAAWGCAVLLALALWIIARRGDEQATDLRAVALGGDASALMRALCAVHALQRIPRRLSAFQEEISAQPSLARRLQAIREAAQIAPATLGAPVVVSSPDLRRVVILGGGRAQWLEGVSPDVPRDAVGVLSSADSIRSLTYRELTDLRLTTSFRGATWLTATHRSGRSWRVPLRPQDVDAAQAALDVVDERLAPQATFTRRRAALLVLYAAVAAFSAWLQVGISPVIILAAMVIVRPRQSPAWMVALLTVTWALQNAAAPASAVPPLGEAVSVAIMAVGGMAFVFGPAARRRAEFRPTPRATAVVAGTLMAAGGLLAADILWVARTAAASIPHWRLDAVALSLLAGATVLALSWARSWIPWITAGVVIALSVAIARWGSAVLAAWSPLAAGTPVTMLDVPAPPAQVIALDPSARRLALSPSAQQFAIQVGRARSGLPYRFVVGRFDGEPQLTSAYDVAFVDDRLILLLGPTATGLGLRGSALIPDPTGELLPQAFWSVALPPVYMPRVSTDTLSGTWTVVGWHPEDADAISVVGRIGDSMPEVKRWSIPGADANATFFYLPATRAAFLVTPTKLPYRAALLSRVAGVPERRWELRKLDGTNGATLAVTAAPLACLDPLPRDTTLVCLARHAAHTVIWSVDGRSGALREIGAVPPFKWAALSSANLRFVTADGAVVQIPRGARQGTRFTPRAVGDIVEITSTDHHLAMLLRSANDVRLALYASR